MKEVLRTGKSEFRVQHGAGTYAAVTRETEMTSARHQSPDYMSCLYAGLPFAKAFALGLLLTWVVTVVVGVTPARAADPVLLSTAGQESGTSNLPATAGGYVATRNGGFGSGLLEPSLTAVLRRVTPIAARDESVVELRGDIDAGTVRTLVAAIRRGQREFAITSRGGEFMVAREMAELLNESGSTLVAVGQCHSSCAYLWLASQKRRLGPSANLALHASYTAEGITNHGELWLREMGRADLAQWARSKEMRELSVRDLRI